MSDVGMPPGFGVWLFALGWIILCAAGLSICLLLALFRAPRGSGRCKQNAFFGWAVGAVVSAIAAGVTLWLVNWSGSLGAFAKWIDQRGVTVLWMVSLAALWPLSALLWNRRQRRNARG